MARQPAPRKRAAAPAKKAALRKAPAKKAAPVAAKRAPVKRAAAAPRKAVAKKATTRKTGLRVVKPGEAPPPAADKPKLPPTITEAAEAGDERALLVALRKKLAQTIQDSSTPARDQASLSIRLLQINRDIQAIDARAKEESQDAAEVEDEAFDPEAL